MLIIPCAATVENKAYYGKRRKKKKRKSNNEKWIEKCDPQPRNLHISHKIFSHPKCSAMYETVVVSRLIFFFVSLFCFPSRRYDDDDDIRFTNMCARFAWQRKYHINGKHTPSPLVQRAQRERAPTAPLE